MIYGMLNCSQFTNPVLHVMNFLIPQLVLRINVTHVEKCEL
jgi:hypothetical protein